MWIRTRTIWIADENRLGARVSAEVRNLKGMTFSCKYENGQRCPLKSLKVLCSHDSELLSSDTVSDHFDSQRMIKLQVMQQSTANKERNWGKDKWTRSLHVWILFCIFYCEPTRYPVQELNMLWVSSVPASCGHFAEIDDVTQDRRLST